MFSFAIRFFANKRFAIKPFNIKHSVLIFKPISVLNFELNFKLIVMLNFGLNFKQIFELICVLNIELIFELNHEKESEVVIFEKSGLGVFSLANKLFASKLFAIKHFNIDLFVMINAEQQLNKELQTKLEQIMLERNMERMRRKTEIKKEEHERMAWLEAEETPLWYWPAKILPKFRAESAHKSKMLD